MKTLKDLICMHHVTVPGYKGHGVNSIIVLFDPNSQKSYIWITANSNTAVRFTEGHTYTIKAHVENNRLKYVDIL